MKQLKYFVYVLGIALLFSACSKDEEAAPEDTWEGAQVGLFAEDARPVKVPDAMAQSSDPHALTASGYISQSTIFAVYEYLFEVPEGATKRSTPITAANGRMAANDYWVYEWGTDSTSIAYQFYTQGDQQVFEIFIGSDKGYFKWMEVVQNKDGKEGTMRWFDDAGDTMIWTWQIRSDESYFLTFNTSSNDYRYEIISNKDLSGSIKTFSDGVLDMEMVWDSAGNGNWKEYDAGSLTDQGSWTA